MQLTQYRDGVQDLLNLENQIRQLIEGQLPRSLISVETIAAILTNITEHLEKYNVPLYLADTSPLDVYKRQFSAFSSRFDAHNNSSISVGNHAF
jgi:hypothetical protein